MTNERPNRRMESYRLIHSNNPSDFQEDVNCLLEDGYEFIGGHMNEGNPDFEMSFYTEMARYEELVNRAEPDPRHTREIFEEVVRAPTTQERMAMAETPAPAPPQTIRRLVGRNDEAREVEPEFEETTQEDARPVQDNRFLWTVDTGDGMFEDEVDDDEMSNHQLNRLGVANNLADDDDGAEQDVTPPPPALREAVEAMRAAEIRRDEMMMDGEPMTEDLI